MTMPTDHGLRDPQADAPPTRESRRRVFISFRREDTYAATLLNEKLTDRFGSECVFFDQRTIRPGVDFAVELRQALRKAEVLLVLIGPQWSTAQRKRLADPDDWVRREIATGFALNKRVIPVLLADTPLPAAADLPLDIADLIRCQYIRLNPSSAAADVDRLVEDLTFLLAPHHGTGRIAPEVPEQLRHALLGLLQTRYRLDETDLERQFPGQPATAAATALVAEGLAEWRTTDRRTLTLTPAGISHAVQQRVEFDDLLARSSFHSRGARRLRRGVPAADTARAVAAANGEDATTETAMTAIWTLVLDTNLPLAGERCQTALRALVTTPPDADHEDLRLFARDRIIKLLRVRLDDCTPTRSDTCTAAWRALRNFTFHGDGDGDEAAFVFTAVYRDHLRNLATALAEDPRRGDHVADLVLRDGAQRIEVQAKNCRWHQPPASATSPSGPAACTSWLIGTTLKTARETGCLRRDIATWSNRCVAVSGSDTTDTRVADEHFHAGRSIVVDLGGMTEQPARRLVDHAADLAYSAGGAVHRVDRRIFLLTPDTDPDDAAPADCGDLFADIFHR